MLSRKCQWGLTGNASGPHRQPRHACPSHAPHPTLRLQATPYSNQFRDPYSILGVAADANETTIRGAYRKMAKQFHPDVSKEQNAEMQFLNISEAYDFLIQLMRSKREGVDIEGTSQRPGSAGNSDAWHDWYWSFRMSRNWERQKSRTEDDAANPPKQASAPQEPAILRTQLAGLRHRAAIRRNRPTPDLCRDTCTASTGAQGPEDQWFVAAEGPSDSADPFCQAVQQPQGAADVNADPIQTSTEPEQQADQAGSQTQPESPFSEQATAQARRKFVSTSEVKDGIKSQLNGMRRKAAIRQQFQHNTANAAA